MNSRIDSENALKNELNQIQNILQQTHLIVDGKLTGGSIFSGNSIFLSMSLEGIASNEKLNQQLISFDCITTKLVFDDNIGNAFTSQNKPLNVIIFTTVSAFLIYLRNRTVVLNQIINQLMMLNHEDHAFTNCSAISFNIATNNKIYQIVDNNYRPKNTLIEKVKKYDIHNKKDIEELEKNEGIKYLHDYNKDIKTKLVIASSHGTGKGVYTNVRIKGDTKVGQYAGKRQTVSDKDQYQEGAGYKFAITVKNKVVGEIDAEGERDFTAYFNHSDQPNIYATIEKDKNGEYQVVFRANRDIEEGEQLLYDYGSHYFYELFSKNDTPRYYLNKNSNWLSPQEIYQENKELYAKGLYRLSESLIKHLEIDTKEFLMPEILLAMLDDNLENFKDLLRNNNYDPNLPLLCVNNKEICDIKQQQYLTTLHFACFLKKSEYVDLLLKHDRINGDICTFHSGNTPLHYAVLVLKGDQEMDDDELVAKLLQSEKKVIFPFHLNNQQLGILHYAIKNNRPVIVEKIFDLAQQENYRHALFNRMYQKPRHKEILANHADFDECISRKKFVILEILLKHIDKNILKEHLKTQNIFKEETFNLLSVQELELVKEIFAKSTHQKVLTSFINKINNIINLIDTHVSINDTNIENNNDKSQKRKNKTYIDNVNDKKSKLNPELSIFKQKSDKNSGSNNKPTNKNKSNN